MNMIFHILFFDMLSYINRCPNPEMDILFFCSWLFVFFKCVCVCIQDSCLLLLGFIVSIFISDVTLDIFGWRKLI